MEGRKSAKSQAATGKDDYAKEDYAKICLGKIGDVAQVLVNGKRYGYAWTAPYEVYVPKRELKSGKNSNT